MRMLASAILVIFLLSSCNTSNKRAMDKIEKESSVDQAKKALEEARKKQEDLEKKVKDQKGLTTKEIEERFKELEDARKEREARQREFEQAEAKRIKETEDQLRREDEAKKQKLEEQRKANEAWEKSEAGQASRRDSLIQNIQREFRRFYDGKRFDAEMNFPDPSELRRKLDALDAQEVVDQRDLQDRINQAIATPNWRADLEKLGCDIPKLYDPKSPSFF